MACESPYVSNCGCDNACPLTLDFKCVLYNKYNQEPTALDGLNLSNGSNLKVVIEQIDDKLAQLNLINHTLIYLRTKYTINTFTQFTTAVNLELSSINDRLNALEA
jgi:hypothetical protein